MASTITASLDFLVIFILPTVVYFLLTIPQLSPVQVQYKRHPIQRSLLPPPVDRDADSPGASVIRSVRIFSDTNRTLHGVKVVRPHSRKGHQLDVLDGGLAQG